MPEHGSQRHSAWHASLGEGARAVLLQQGLGPSQFPHSPLWYANILQVKVAGVVGALPKNIAHCFSVCLCTHVSNIRGVSGPRCLITVVGPLVVD